MFFALSCPTLHDPKDYSLPGSSVHGILQARTLEWVAIGSYSVRNSWQLQKFIGKSNLHALGFEARGNTRNKPALPVPGRQREAWRERERQRENSD